MFKISGNSVKSTYVGSPCSSEEEHPLTTALQVNPFKTISLDTMGPL